MNSTSTDNSSRKPSIAKRALRHLRRNVVAYLALFLALSGSAYAVERGSIGTKQLKKNAVKTAKIANGAVKSKKLAAGSVDTTKLADGAVQAEKIAGSAVQSAKIADGAVAATDLAAGSVTREKLAPGAVGLDQVGIVRQILHVTDDETDGEGSTADFKSGPFTVRVMCIDQQGNNPTYANVQVKSSEVATSTGLYNQPYYKLDANSDFRYVAASMNLAIGGTKSNAVNLWSESGRYLQISVVATSMSPVTKKDCGFLLTGFAG